MSSLTGYVFSLILIAAAHSLAPPSPNPAMNVPLSLTSSSLALLNLSSAANDASLIDATKRNVACNGRRFGSNLDKESCEDAWSKIPTDSQVFVFGPRTRGHFERPLPYRYVSEDARCVIEVTQKQEVDRDTASNGDISAAAKSVLDICVLAEGTIRHPFPTGGLASGVGHGAGLNVKIIAYSADVKCVSEPEYEDKGGCSQLLDTLPVSYNRYVFTRDSAVQPYQVYVPPGGRLVVSESGDCTSAVDLVEGDMDNGSWFEIWAAAVAVEEICVKHGEAGAAFGLGRGKRLMVSLGPKP